MPSRRSPPATVARPILTARRKRAGIEALKRRVDELRAFDPNTIKERFKDPRVMALQNAIDESLSDMFGHGTVEYRRYEAATRLDTGPIYATSEWAGESNDDTRDARRYVAEGKEAAITLLEQAIRRIEDEIAMDAGETPAAPASAERAADNRNVFIVHGRDDGMREAVARFIGSIGFTPVILHEQANQGRTVIEKLESEGGGAGFAIVLLSPEDEGCLKGERPTARARQNVLLELGYFIGTLGRRRVCALQRGELDVPSDFVGVVYERFDETGGWKQVIGRELQAAGYEIDWNSIMRP